MKKLLLVLPTLLLLVAPVSALANGEHNDNHGSKVSVVAKDNPKDLEGNHGSVVSVVAKDNHGHEDEDNDDKNQNEERGEKENREATSSAKENSHLKIKIKIDLKNKHNHGSTVSATNAATPSARINVSGPLDQVIKALEQIINFLKSLI